MAKTSISQVFHSAYDWLRPRPPAPPVASTSRAGRNLPAAITTAVILLSLFGLTLFFWVDGFILVGVIFLSIALWEAAGAFLTRNVHIPLLALLPIQLLMLFLTTYRGIVPALISYLLGAGLLLAIALIRKNGNLRGVIAGVFMLGWIGLAGCFLLGMLDLPGGSHLIVAAILLTVASDTGGWLLGILIGKHPILPRISPKKSWEGLLGSLLLCLLAAFLGIFLLLGKSWSWVLVFAFLTPPLATMGDFAESALKRDLGIKDMGIIFPGHGGMLDRLDSLLFCAPVFYCLFLFMQH